MSGEIPNVLKLKSDELKKDGKEYTLLGDAVSNHKPSIMFVTASWCGHCRKLATVIDELTHLCHGKNLSNMSDVKYCNIYQYPSGDKNTQPRHPDLDKDIRGYPMILLFDESGKMFSEYKGERTAASILTALSAGCQNPDWKNEALSRLKQISSK